MLGVLKNAWMHIGIVKMKFVHKRNSKYFLCWYLASRLLPVFYMGEKGKPSEYEQYQMFVCVGGELQEVSCVAEY